MATKRTRKSAPVPEDEGPPEAEGVEFLTPEEWQAMLEEIAQRDLGMSAAEFEPAYWAGRARPMRGSRGGARRSAPAARVGRS
jgi:hypothetical protein